MQQAPDSIQYMSVIYSSSGPDDGESGHHDSWEHALSQTTGRQERGWSHQNTDHSSLYQERVEFLVHGYHKDLEWLGR